MAWTAHWAHWSSSRKRRALSSSRPTVLLRPSFFATRSQGPERVRLPANVIHTNGITYSPSHTLQKRECWGLERHVSGTVVPGAPSTAELEI
ncbi:LOW QUALITY PROTEIN: hypothetical protein CVT26_013121 [Gymnopilus dilepis]|uniref:Uncharacterized protein n=1 Tax=Gymnopilus dilepis TaxID=231916 RepID=A0A409YF45_9AGAR|nr:LOW QUALITY PROTEIN: hypothetical protein CVT26_013121 [Gymnopilus dilepis]